MRTFLNSLIILPLTLVGTKGVRAQHDASVASHTIIAKGKFNYKLPLIEDDNFCRKLHQIGISKKLPFFDSTTGNETSFFFTFTITFHMGSKVPLIKEGGNSQEVNVRPVINGIISLLQHEKWKVFPSSYSHNMYFECSLTKNGIDEVVLRSNDNLDLYNMCQ